MPFSDLLRMTVLLAAASATALAAVTAIAANRADDTRTLIVAAVWWTAALAIGLVMGRSTRAAEAMRPLLSGARTTPTLPFDERGGVALARLWPLGAFALVAGGLGFVFPGVAAIGTGFGLAAALALRGWERAVIAIEGRDGVRFYVEPGSALQPVTLVRTPGLRRDRPPGGHPPPPPVEGSA
ncbi:MAG: hypothetical protein M3M99_06575 [Actinomycetota bacterium]|nr:hypothetical protein [Actinomycetota bacterium]